MSDNHWNDDLLGRQTDAEFIRQFLTGRIEERKQNGKVASYVLNVDASWGEGKTFFLKRLKLDLEDRKLPVAYINAWENDHAVDALIIVIEALDRLYSEKSRTKTATKAWETAKSEGLNIAVATGKAFAKTFAKKHLGAELDVIIDQATKDSVSAAGEQIVEGIVDKLGEVQLDSFRKTQTSIEKFKNNLRVLVAEKGPLFVLIDELDRCRPTFAIEMLERVKHLFGIDQVIFILASDTEQLQHSIKAVYGAGFDSANYLNRFFDRTYRFAGRLDTKLVASLFETSPFDNAKLSVPPNYEVPAFFEAVSRLFGMTPRDIEQSFDLLHTIVTLWSKDTPPLQLIYLLPLLFATKRNNVRVLEELREGRFSAALLPGPPLQITFDMRSHSFDRAQPESIEFRELLSRYLGMARHTLAEIVQQNHNGSSWWLQMQFTAEHQMHGHARRRVHSITQEYPSLVRRAGHFGHVERR